MAVRLETASVMHCPAFEPAFRLLVESATGQKHEKTWPYPPTLRSTTRGKERDRHKGIRLYVSLLDAQICFRGLQLFSRLK